MFGQDGHVCIGRRCVEDNSCLLHQMSKTDNLVKTSKCVCWEGATRRIVKRSYGSGWSTLCVFRHHLLKTLLFFHCSSRDVPHLRQTVRDEYSIALPSKCAQSRSPQSAVSSKIVTATFVFVCRVASSS